jgi:hypothetical protein
VPPVSFTGLRIEDMEDEKYEILMLHATLNLLEGLDLPLEVVIRG